MGHLVSDLAGAGTLMAGGLAGAGGMLVSSVAAGLAVNSQWFTPAAASGDKKLHVDIYCDNAMLFRLCLVCSRGRLGHSTDRLASDL